ncbi:hypothetical protein [Thalassoglobus polymorphus]|uniref:Uncharacterized protein n=1 Tax=Thalassoglobus polymorphus TaxID=2527994 RepID=A0A517QQ57_9PLAN|nr:hypothetical protein [Thalassoglobus polymorphus]QDT33765.1 hypothetical protein Mal48_30200 [Thalassoglobus polymorphus]
MILRINQAKGSKEGPYEKKRAAYEVACCSITFRSNVAVMSR